MLDKLLCLLVVGEVGDEEGEERDDFGVVNEAVDAREGECAR